MRFVTPTLPRQRLCRNVIPRREPRNLEILRCACPEHVEGLRMTIPLFAEPVLPVPSELALSLSKGLGELAEGLEMTNKA